MTKAAVTSWHKEKHPHPFISGDLTLRVTQESVTSILRRKMRCSNPAVAIYRHVAQLAERQISDSDYFPSLNFVVTKMAVTSIVRNHPLSLISHDHNFSVTQESVTSS